MILKIIDGYSLWLICLKCRFFILKLSNDCNYKQHSWQHQVSLVYMATASPYSCHDHQGEEITFDYNFVRVGGADAKKCECGANKCRGFIGVDPDTPQNVLEIDSDDGEDPEPIRLQVDSDDEFDDYLDKTKEGVPKKRRMISGRESMNENNWKLGGVKRKFYSGGAKDMKNPKRSRRVKTAATSKIGNLKPAPPRLFSGSRFGIRNKNHSDGRISTSFSIPLHAFLVLLVLVMGGTCDCHHRLKIYSCSRATNSVTTHVANAALTQMDICTVH